MLVRDVGFDPVDAGRVTQGTVLPPAPDQCLYLRGHSGRTFLKELL
jgi:hypothetical protein